MEQNHLMPTSTPWGASQTSHKIAPGILFYSTASHGGYHLSLDRFDTFRQFFPDFTPWAGDPWFEEDCDSTLVTITFAQHFSDEAVFCAEQIIRACVQHEKSSNGKWHQVWANITNNKTFDSVLRRAANFRHEHAEDWQVGTAGTNGDAWQVHMTRLKDGAQHWKIFPDYPDKCFYSSTEVFGSDAPTAFEGSGLIFACNPSEETNVQFS